MSAYALVLARGGSRGLPGKNVRLLGGHPLVAWSVAAARVSGAVDRIICSTDSEEIAAIARAYGAETPFMRPSELADDFSTDLDVFQHAAAWLLDHGETPDMFVQLRPTCPFRDPQWIDDAVARMSDNPEITCVRSVTPAEHTPYKMWRMNAEHNLLEPLLTVEGMAEPYNMPRQKLPVVYRHTGQIDVIRTETIFRGSMTGPVIAPLFTDAGMAIDIDTLLDFQIGELVFSEAMPTSVQAAAAEVGRMAQS